MYRLGEPLVAAIEARRTLLVPTRQRAAAVRLAYAWRQRAAGIPVWETPDVIAWETWLARELARVRQRRGAGPSLVNPSQELALWQEIVSAVADGEEQAERAVAHAESIASAAVLAREWRLSWPSLGVPEEAQLLQRAMAAMDAHCRASDVIAARFVDDETLATFEPASLTFVGFGELTPRQAYVRELFARQGFPCESLAGSGTRGSVRASSYAVAADEVAAVGAWCGGKLAADPAARLLILCADRHRDLAALRDDLLDVLAPGAAPDASEFVAIEGGAPLIRHPLVAAALSLLALCEADIDIANLGALLLSPYHTLGDVHEAARLDAWLRDRVPRQCGSRELEHLLIRAPEAVRPAAQRLARMLATSRTICLAGDATAREWASRYSALVTEAGHPGQRAANSVEMQAWERWQSALAEFASLDAVAPRMSRFEAQVRFEALLRRAQHQAATGDAAVTLTHSLGDPVVGYDGLWVLGLGEGQWPEPPRPNPYIPFATQRRAGLPEASARGRLAAARRQQAAWEHAAAEVVFSHPRTDADLHVAPSALLGVPIEPQELRRASWMGTGAAIVEPTEMSLPAVDVTARLRAGSRLPELQRECAFRAQAELRLGATELPAPRVGIDPRMRGQLLHRSLELLWNRIGSSRNLRSRPIAEWASDVAAAVAEAFAKFDPGTHVVPTSRELAREQDRCRELLAQTLALEARRGVDFTVEDREIKRVWQVAGVKLNLRIDRVDRLEDGSLAVVDYKTGASAKLDLLSDEPRPVQLLAYLDALDAGAPGSEVAALSLLKLVPGRIEFRSIEDGRAGLPAGRGAPKVERPWDEQVAFWRRDVQNLVSRHLAGEAEVLPLPGACQYCALPGLCRIGAAALAEALEAGESDEGEAE